MDPGKCAELCRGTEGVETDRSLSDELRVAISARASRSLVFSSSSSATRLEKASVGCEESEKS